MIVMMNSYVHSIIDYGLDIWAVRTNIQLKLIQDKIDRFLVTFFLPSIVRRTKKGFTKAIPNINVCTL